MRRYFDKYVFVAPGSDYGRAMWSDLADNPDCVFLEYPIISGNPFLRLAHHLHFSFGINQKISLPFQFLWRKRYSLDSLDFDDNLKYCVILPDVSACRMDTGYLDKLKNQRNIETVLVNVNVIAKKKKLLDERIPCFSKIFSFDKQDCSMYGYIFYPTIYSQPILSKNANTGDISDAFFVGSFTEERYQKLVRLHTFITDANGKTDFHIIGVPKSKKRVEGIHYNRPLSYQEALEKMQRTNCIVEIMNPGQTGLTLRAMEAICCDKKLLTDNATIRELKYYSRGFIRYCNPITEPDIDFILGKENVNYRYENDFSPNRLIERIETEFREVAN